MPIGGGVLPATGSTQYTELTYVTRRAFIPKLVVQIYNSTPLMAALIANAQIASGGVSSVTVNVQGAAYTTVQWSDASASFNQPAVTQGAWNAEFNLKLMICAIPFIGMEGIVQQDHAITSLIEARMNDAGNNMMDAAATALYNNTSDGQQFLGLPGAIDDSTNLTTYGNLSRATNTWWKSKVYNAGNVNPTRQNVLQYLAGTVKNCAEVPTFGICGFGTWTLLAQDFVGQEEYQVTPGSSFASGEDSGPSAAFTALKVGNVPIYADPYCPEGTLYFVNTNYLNLYIHERGSFAFTGFESTLPNWQIGYVGAVVLIGELVNVKPKAHTRVGSYNSLTL